MRPGQRLKELRNRLGITTRDVEEQSRGIAEEEGNEEFYISNPWLTQIENKDSVPSIYKLYSLSIAYRVSFTDLFLLYGIDLEKINRVKLARPPQKTSLETLEVYNKDRTISFPVQFDSGFRPEKTTLLSRIVEVWGEVPIALIEHLDIRHGKYGFVGLEDFTLYPMLRPGSFVQIDDRETKVRTSPWRTEFDRPVYFVELRDGYACSWCELKENQLFLVPHPLSQCTLRQYAYPLEAEIVGRVTAVAMRLVDPPRRPAGEPPRLPKPS